MANSHGDQTRREANEPPRDILPEYYLWRTGEVMTHHRENFERVYALTEAVAPAHLLREGDEAEADRFLIKKDINFSGLSRLNHTADSFFRGVPFSNMQEDLV